MSVPACPIPTQNTKFVMSHAQPTGWLRPQMPIPSQNSHETATPSRPRSARDGMKKSHQPIGVARSTGSATASVMEWKSGERRISVGRPATGLSSSSASVWAKPVPRFDCFTAATLPRNADLRRCEGGFCTILRRRESSTEGRRGASQDRCAGRCRPARCGPRARQPPWRTRRRPTWPLTHSPREAHNSAYPTPAHAPLAAAPSCHRPGCCRTCSRLRCRPSLAGPPATAIRLCSPAWPTTRAWRSACPACRSPSPPAMAWSGPRGSAMADLEQNVAGAARDGVPHRVDLQAHHGHGGDAAGGARARLARGPDSAVRAGVPAQAAGRGADPASAHPHLWHSPLSRQRVRHRRATYPSLERAMAVFKDDPLLVRARRAGTSTRPTATTCSPGSSNRCRADRSTTTCA